MKQYTQEEFDRLPKINGYGICQNGEIIGKRFMKPLVKLKSSKGYQFVYLYDNGDRIFSLVHRLVAKAYCYGYENWKVVNHKDGNKVNNQYSNLEWVTRSENATHAINTLGRKPGKRKVDSNDILLMRELRRNGYLLVEIADVFNISESRSCELTRKIILKSIEKALM